MKALIAALLVSLFPVVLFSQDDNTTSNTSDLNEKSAAVSNHRAAKKRALPLPIASPDDDQRAYRELSALTELDAQQIPFAGLLEHFATVHRLPIRIDDRALAAAKVPSDSPVTLSMNKVPLRRILSAILIPLNLDYQLRGSELLISTRGALRKRLHDVLTYQLQILDYLCEFNDEQLLKLHLARRRDLRQWQKAIEDCKKKLHPIADDKSLTESLLEVEQLRDMVELGPFARDSQLYKTLETRLTPEQLSKYGPVRQVVLMGGRVGTVRRNSDVILSIDLNETPLTDNDLTQLKELTILGALNLDQTKVTDAGVNHLLEMKNLRSLRLSATEVTDNGLAELKKLQGLEELALFSSKVTDSGLKHIGEMKNLENLFLSHLPITDAGLVHLKGLTSLQRIDLRGTQVTEAGIAELMQTFPDLKLEK